MVQNSHCLDEVELPERIIKLHDIGHAKLNIVHAKSFLAFLTANARLARLMSIASTLLLMNRVAVIMASLPVPQPATRILGLAGNFTPPRSS